MKSLIVNETGELYFREISMPQYNDYQVLVKMICCGVCNGTDFKLIHGTFKGFNSYPAVLGHEGVGIVIEKGKKVKNFDIGDYILRPGLEGQQDGYFSGWGAFSEYGIAGDWKAMLEDGISPDSPEFLELYYSQQIVPKGIDPIDASMAITLKEVFSAVKRFGFKKNQSAVIFGMGPVGLSFLQFAKLIGMNSVICCDIKDERLTAAKRAGADFVINSSDADIKDEVLKIRSTGVDYVVDAVGISHIINQAMELIKFNGKICVYGISPNLNMQLDWGSAPYNWNLEFVQWPTFIEESETHSQIMDWIKNGMINPKDYISHVMKFDDVIEAFKLVEEKKATKIIIEF